MRALERCMQNSTPKPDASKASRFAFPEVMARAGYSRHILEGDRRHGKRGGGCGRGDHHRRALSWARHIHSRRVGDPSQLRPCAFRAPASTRAVAAPRGGVDGGAVRVCQHLCAWRVDCEPAGATRRRAAALRVHNAGEDPILARYGGSQRHARARGGCLAGLAQRAQPTRATAGNPGDTAT